MPRRGDSWTKQVGLGVLPFLLIATGCSGEFDGISEAELHRRARKLPLKERYDLYLLDRLESRPPKGSALVEDIAALGEPAWHYTIARASNATDADVWTALPVLDLFNRRCSDAEYAALMKVAVTADMPLRPMLLESLRDTCRRDEPDPAAHATTPERKDISPPAP